MLLNHFAGLFKIFACSDSIGLDGSDLRVYIDSADIGPLAAMSTAIARPMRRAAPVITATLTAQKPGAEELPRRGLSACQRILAKRAACKGQGADHRAARREKTPTCYTGLVLIHGFTSKCVITCSMVRYGLLA
jgi:hypothetical protein